MINQPIDLVKMRRPLQSVRPALLKGPSRAILNEDVKLGPPDLAGRHSTSQPIVSSRYLMRHPDGVVRRIRVRCLVTGDVCVSPADAVFPPLFSISNACGAGGRGRIQRPTALTAIIQNRRIITKSIKSVARVAN